MPTITNVHPDDKMAVETQRKIDEINTELEKRYPYMAEQTHGRKPAEALEAIAQKGGRAIVIFDVEFRQTEYPAEVRSALAENHEFHLIKWTELCESEFVTTTNITTLNIATLLDHSDDIKLIKRAEMLLKLPFDHIILVKYGLTGYRAIPLGGAGALRLS